jgi:hypothetical protein
MIGRDSPKSRVVSYHAEQGIFELLNELNDITSILLTDDEGKLVNIITKRDTLVFFRQRAEELILIENIENAIKSHILHVYQDAEELQKEVDDFVGNRKKTDSYLHYIKEAVVATFVAKGHELDIHDEVLHEIVNEHFPLTKQKGFTDLSFDNFIKIILRNWGKFEGSFKRNPEIWQKLLEDVRDIRNKLFHFKGEITDKEREKLHSCASWMENMPYASIARPAQTEE